MSRMRKLLECGAEGRGMVVPLLHHIRKSIVERNNVPKRGIPPTFIEQVDELIDRGFPVFRIFIILSHVHCDAAFRAYMFAGERPSTVVAFMVRLEAQINAALMGRKPDQSKYSDEEIAAGQAGFDRCAGIVVHMQGYYLSL
jgi:hypothetical protein